MNLFTNSDYCFSLDVVDVSTNDNIDGSILFWYIHVWESLFSKGTPVFLDSVIASLFWLTYHDLS